MIAFSICNCSTTRAASSRGEIQTHLQEIYGVEVSADLITTLTDGVLEEVCAWRARPLEAVYPVLWLDALQVKIKDQGRIANRAIYLAIGLNLRGHKEVLGMWGAASEGARVLAADRHRTSAARRD